MIRSDTWPEPDKQLLRQLWAQGLSGAAIGQRLGRTKNAVIGCVHRLKLPGRSSPIRSVDPTAVPSRVRKAVVKQVPRNAATLPELAEAAAPAAAVPPGQSPPCLPLVSAAPASATADELVPTLRPAPTPRQFRAEPCCWLIGERGTRSYRSCDDPVEKRLPYCAAHAELAYKRPVLRQVA